MQEQLVVFGGISIGRRIPVPGGQVNSHSHSILPAGIGKFFDDIPMASLIRRVCDRMIGILAWPKAETVMVFRGQDHLPDTRFLSDPDPLPDVEMFRVKQ